MNNIYSMQTYNITMTAGTGGQIQVFKNGTDLGYFRGTKTITANDGDAISVWCDADAGYVFTNLCTPSACTTARPFNFTANMNISMTATFTSTTGCPATNNTLLINGQLSSLTVAPQTVLDIKIKMSSRAGKQWKLIRIIDSNNPVADTVLASGTLDSNGCGSSSVMLTAAGIYQLKVNSCDVWVGDYGAHCFTSDSLTNLVSVVVKSATGGGTGCNQETCPSNKNLCILGNCIPKNIVFIGAAGFILLMMTKGD